MTRHLEPIPFFGYVEIEDEKMTNNIPHIVDTGASVNKMTTEELIEALDQRYGNPYATECALIQEAIKVLRFQAEEIKALVEQVQ